MTRLETLAREIARRQTATGSAIKVVLAESCTAGLAAASLAGVPGASAWLCGSMVVYRTETKQAWLSVNPPGFSPPERDSVGPQTAIALARAILKQTPEADLAAAICGHLGPDADPELNGRNFMAIVPSDRLGESGGAPVQAEMKSTVDQSGHRESVRVARQQEAAAFLLENLLTVLSRVPAPLSN